MKITVLPHARRRMAERGIAEDEVRAVLEEPDLLYAARSGRAVAEKTFSGRSLATKVVYNVGLEEDERIIVTVERGRATRW